MPDRLFEKDKCFIALANFGLRLLKHITPPPNLPKETGFLVEITQKRKDDVIKRYFILHAELHMYIQQIVPVR